MSTVNIRLPDSLHKGVQEAAQRDGISVDQFIVTAVAEKLAALMTEEYLRKRADRASRSKYEAALSKVPDIEPDLNDQ